MDQHVVRALKAYCPTFNPIRQVLLELGAMFIETTEQSDVFFHLPATGERDTQRLKFRTENGHREILYFYDRSKTGLLASPYQTWYIDDPKIKEILSITLGIRVIVHKRREKWEKGSFVFHLDKVDKVGKIFEIEIYEQNDDDALAQVEILGHQLDPYLGSRIIGSNEDLITDAIDTSTPS